MHSQRVDMALVAQLAGVSKSTVSRVLNGSGPISQATQRKVRTVIEQLGYRPNLLASSMRNQRTATLGIVVSHLLSPLFGLIIRGIERSAQEHGYSLLLACSEGDPEQERKQVDLMLQKAVDGLLVFPTGGAANLCYYQKFLEGDVPLVFVDREIPGLAVDLVATDNHVGGYLAGQQFVQHGHQHYAFLHLPMPEQQNSSLADRLAGFNRALVEAGLSPAQELGKTSEARVSEEEHGYQTMREAVAARCAFDALLAGSDSLAFGAIRALYDAGKRVPDDMAVMGFDDKPVAAYFRPSLSVIRQPMSEMGEEALSLLVRRMQAKTKPSSCQRILLTPRLVLRESCGGPVS